MHLFCKWQHTRDDRDDDVHDAHYECSVCKMRKYIRTFAHMPSRSITRFSIDGRSWHWSKSDARENYLIYMDCKIHFPAPGDVPPSAHDERNGGD